MYNKNELFDACQACQWKKGFGEGEELFRFFTSVFFFFFPWFVKKNNNMMAFI